MMKKQVLTGIVATALTVVSISSPLLSSTVKAVQTEPTETTISKTEVSNPIGGYVNGNLIYGGDPAVLVDGDTVYLYTGHDTAQNEAYKILEWMCYSTKDLKNWNYEGVVMKADKASIPWASTGTDAWAGQVAKYKGKYYLYHCTWDATSAGKQSIGVAVADKATGPFKDIGKPLVKGTDTNPQTSDFNDIDPTIYIETDSKGVEHRYLAWGNGKYYICELNEDMISVKDLNNDGKITCGTSASSADIIEQSPITAKDGGYTEAPWLYRRTDANGKPTGPYYLFYAMNWREEMAYSTTNDLLNGSWTFGKQLMPPAATSNTNHMAVFDFKGKTYFVYHNGSLPGGSGFRRNACIAEVHFNADGSIQPIPETAIGITGAEPYVLYTDTGAMLSHENFINSSGDGEYPYTTVGVGTYFQPKDEDRNWAIIAGKSDPSKDSYVSIQSENKPGLYLTVNDNNTVSLAQDYKYKAQNDQIISDADTAKAQTFRTVKGLTNAEAISFESIAKPGYYLCIDGGSLMVKALEDCDSSTDFYLNKSPKAGTSNSATAGTENDISSLKINGEEIIAQNKVYQYKVPYTSETAALQLTAKDTKGFITLDGKVLSSTGTATIYLTGAKKEATIDVYAENEKLAASYTLSIERDFSNFTFTEQPIKTFPFNNSTNGATAVTKAKVPVEKADAVYNYAEGKLGQAIVLDGSYGLKLCDAKELSESYSISFWMKPTALGGAVDPTLAAGTFEPEQWLNLSFDAKIWSKKGDYISTPAANAYKTNTWQNVVLSVDGNKAGSLPNTVTANLYLDGVLISSGDIASNIMAGNAAIYFGVNAWDAYFTGALDDVRIFNKALDNNEAIALSIASTEIDSNKNDINSDNTNQNKPTEIPTDTDTDKDTDTNTDTDNKAKKTVKKVAITKKGSKKAITKIVSLKTGKNLKLAAKVTITGGASKKVTWTSSNKKIASVSAKGIVKANSKGIAKITATSKANKNKKCTIKIKVK